MRIKHRKGAKAQLYIDINVIIWYLYNDREIFPMPPAFGIASKNFDARGEARIMANAERNLSE